MQRIIRDLSFFYLALLLVTWVALELACDRWWPGTLLGFAPRWLAAAPLAVMLPATLFFHIRLVPLYLVHSIVVAVPIMGLSPMGVLSIPPAPTEEWLRVVTVNSGGREFDTDELVRMIRDQQADVLCLQECPPANADQIFSDLGWHVRREGLLAIGSPWELGEADVLARHHPDEHNIMALSCPLSWHDRTVQVVNVHLPTPRPGIEAMWSGGIEQCDQLTQMIRYRREASGQVSEAVDQMDGPRIVMGDFNMPIDSQIYQTCWGGWRNAFSRCGWGFGYTKFTRWHAIRIDHVLCDDLLRPQTARVGADLRGDHRPVIVDFELAP